MKQESNPINGVKKQRALRYFSEAARKAIVEEIDNGLGKAEASRRYGVSETTIYRWMMRYSTHYGKSLITVIEHKSDSIRSKKLEQELNKAYELLGKSQAEVMYLQAIIDQANEAYGTDLKKNSATPSFSTFGNNNKQSK